MATSSRRPTASIILSATDMKPAAIPAQHANRATERRAKLRLRELCDEVLASYQQARGQDLFSSDDRRMARELMASVVKPR
jgi:hypothetical protein